jgi:hypothetical protein
MLSIPMQGNTIFLNYGGADYIEKKFVDAAVYYHA